MITVVNIDHSNNTALNYFRGMDKDQMYQSVISTDRKTHRPT